MILRFDLSQKAERDNVKWQSEWSDESESEVRVRVKWWEWKWSEGQSEVMRVKVKWGSEWSDWVRAKAGVKYYNGLKREWPDGVRFEWEWSDGVIVKEWRESQVSDGKSRSRVMGSYWSKVWGETGGVKWEGRDGMKAKWWSETDSGVWVSAEMRMKLWGQREVEEGS